MYFLDGLFNLASDQTKRVEVSDEQRTHINHRTVEVFG